MSIDVSQCEILDHKTLVKLWRRWKRKKDKEAWHKLFYSQLRLAYQIADKFNNPKYSSDLKSEAAIAVLEAIENWDPSRGRLSTITTLIVRQRLFRYLQSNMTIIRIPYDKFKKLRILELESENGVLPDFFEQIRTIKEDSIHFPECRKFDVMDTRTNDDRYKEELISVLKEKLKDLKPILREIIEGYFGLNGKKKTLKELAERYNLSTVKVKFMLERGLRQLKQMLGDVLYAEVESL